MELIKCVEYRPAQHSQYSNKVVNIIQVSLSKNKKVNTEMKYLFVYCCEFEFFNTFTD